MRLFLIEVQVNLLLACVLFHYYPYVAAVHLFFLLYFCSIETGGATFSTVFAFFQISDTYDEESEVAVEQMEKVSHAKNVTM